MSSNERRQSKFKKRSKNPKKQFVKKKPRSAKESEEIEKLCELYTKYDAKAIKTFSDMPLSNYTQKALKNGGFVEPTDIQRQSIGLALKGLDVLGAAKTGSGKTLAFLIPLLERLYSSRWSKLDGLGALVITPTRELAYQIFETLRKIGVDHDFSAGLVIGGKDLKFESKRMSQCNIVICTPGRLLQHMDENPQFDAGTLQILILDEADRCLDLGFAETMNAIIANLPVERQTLLFSATQTRSVKDLARLSLKDPVYVSVHEHSQYSTPDKLTQNYLVCELHQKMEMLWSFIKNHRKKKILVFLQSCKQVRYLQELLKRLRVGTSILGLYGTLHQLRRMSIYEEFCQRQDSCVLLATDIAARGLDFPRVDWVFQLDCPEDSKTYLHRVGRTARHVSIGQSLLVLTPSEEEGMVKQLSIQKVPIEKIEVNPKKLTSVQLKIEANLAGDRNLKEMAQRAFQSYIKSIYLMKNKTVFDVFKLDLDKFSKSLGLVVTPRVRFLQKQIKMRNQGEGIKAQSQSFGGDDDDEEENRCKDDDDFDNDDDDILTLKRKDHALEDDDDNETLEDSQGFGNNKKKVITKASLAKKVLKKKIVANTVVQFNEDGEAKPNITTQKMSSIGQEYEKADDKDKGGIDVDTAKLILKAEDHFDKKLERTRIKERHREERKKMKEMKNKRQKQAIKEEEEEDEESDESQGGPNLDWLPDPDNIYSSESSSTDSSDEDVINNDGTKRKWKPPKKEKAEKKRRIEENHDSSTLRQDEDLALQLLSQK